MGKYDKPNIPHDTVEYDERLETFTILDDEGEILSWPWWQIRASPAKKLLLVEVLYAAWWGKKGEARQVFLAQAKSHEEGKTRVRVPEEEP